MRRRFCLRLGMSALVFQLVGHTAWPDDPPAVVQASQAVALLYVPTVPTAPVGCGCLLDLTSLGMPGGTVLVTPYRIVAGRPNVAFRFSGGDQGRVRSIKAMDEATGLCFLDIGPATRQGLTCETSLGTRQDLYWAGFGSDLQPYVKHWPEATLHRLENGRLSDRGNLNLVDRWESFQLDKAGGSTVLRHPSMTCGIPLLTAQGTLAAVVLDASQTSSPTRILEFVPVESLRRVALLREPIALDSEDNRRASFRSLSAMLSKLPANARPAKNETEWAGDAAAAANQWLSKYVVGQFFELNSRLVVLTQPDYYPSLRPGNSSLLLLPTDVPTVSTVPGRPPIRVLSLFFLADAHNRAVVDLANKQTRDPQLQRFVANAKFRGRVQRAFVPTVEEKRRTIREFEQATSSPYDFLLKKSGPMSIEFHDLVVVVGDLELIGP